LGDYGRNDSLGKAVSAAVVEGEGLFIVWRACLDLFVERGNEWRCCLAGAWFWTSVGIGGALACMRLLSWCRAMSSLEL